MANDPPPPSSATINMHGAADQDSAVSPVTEASPPGQSNPCQPIPSEALGVFGRYQLQRLLDKGGMGAVYLAHDTLLQRTVALKLPRFAPDDGDMRLRFLREARPE
jgi:serine/threonine protein kinase